MGILMPRADMLTTIRRLGLTNSLKLCLDAGDAASYTSGQSWLDRGGNGYDFFLGADGSATATDPTFNGTAGKRSNGEYFSFDGGDYFTYDTTNETWMTNIHKDNAKYSFAFWMRHAGATGGGVVGNGDNTATGVGFSLGRGGTGLPFIAVYNGSGSLAMTFSSAAATTTTDTFFAVSVDEAAGTGIMFQNSLIETFTSTYTSPSAAAATNTLKIGTRGDTGTQLVNETRLYSCVCWEGASLTQSQLSALFMATRGKFGV